MLTPFCLAVDTRIDAMVRYRSAGAPLVRSNLTIGLVADGNFQMNVIQPGGADPAALACRDVRMAEPVLLPWDEPTCTPPSGGLLPFAAETPDSHRPIAACHHF